MVKNQKILLFIAKILLVTAALLSLYYLAYLKPKIELQNKLNDAENTISPHMSALIQNRIAYLELTRLNANSINFQTDILSIVNNLQETQREGLKNISEKNTIPEIEELDTDFPELIKETEDIYKKQEELIVKVTATDSFEEGVRILKSDEAIILLTRQTNLILKYRLLSDQIKEEKLNLW